MSDVKIYTNGAYIPRYTVGGSPEARPFWRVGNLLLSASALELTSKAERHVIPLASVTAVTGLPTGMLPPPVSFEQAIQLHHVEAGTTVTTPIAFPRVTVKNFPLQLAAMLTGTVRIYIPTGSGIAAAYEEAMLRFAHDEFRIQRAVGEARIPLDTISNLTFSLARDTARRDYLEVMLHYVDAASVRSINFLATERLAFLQPLLGAVQGMRRNVSLVQPRSAADALSESAQQVAVLLYTGGVSASAIEGMLAIAPDALDKIYDDLLARGLAEVVKVRKEIQLTAAGAKVVDDIMKKQLTTG